MTTSETPARRYLWRARMVKRTFAAIVLVGIMTCAALYYYFRHAGTRTDPIDDAQACGLTDADFPQLKTDVFRQMDGGIALSREEAMGRNTWILWTAGSQVMLDQMAKESYGLIDIVKVLDSRKRGTRFQEAGLINEPGFKQAAAPNEYGLWIDVPDDEGPTAVDKQIAAEGVDERVYGKSTGILGLRLFPNPNFKGAAKEKWDADRYYSDPTYYTDPNLVRPYTVGMTCGLCHISHNPLRRPKTPFGQIISRNLEHTWTVTFRAMAL
jgi:hypothetical protein